MIPRAVAIHYRRLPDRETVFDQILVHESEGCSVTLLDSTPLRRPLTAGGRTVLEPGASVVWFTFPGRWYDVGRFHLADGTFTGCYANLLTPVAMETSRWETTDLCLDVWMGSDGRVELLDEEEFNEAVARGWMDPSTARTARAEADVIMAAARERRWPPDPVADWDLRRARRAAAPHPTPR